MKTFSVAIFVPGINQSHDFKIPAQMQISNVIHLCVEILREQYNLPENENENALRLLSINQKRVLSSDLTALQNELSENEKLILL